MLSKYGSKTVFLVVLLIATSHVSIIQCGKTDPELNLKPNVVETSKINPDGGEDTVLFFHHTYEKMVQLMYEVHKECPEVTRIYNLSEPSVEGRNLTVLEITENPGVHTPGKPEFKYIGNMHGNEVVGKELLLYLMVSLCEKYKRGDELSKFIVSQTRVHIMPSMNPDGWEAAFREIQDTGESSWLTGRENAKGVDLNRNFPDLNAKIYKIEREHKGRNNHLIKVEKAITNDKMIQPETRAVMRWLAQIGFVLSANLHGGDIVANYPYDDTRSGKLQEYTACPDDSTFVYLAKSYAYFHATMADPNRIPCDKEGDNKPITNGGLWYSVAKGMQDYNYLSTNCFEITLELGCKKFPPSSTLERYWLDNADALFNYILQSHIGVKGFVMSTEKKPLANAEIKVSNLSSGLPILHDILSLEDGDYYRLLADGYYHILAEADGYHPTFVCVHIVNSIQVDASDYDLHPAREVNFTLVADSSPKPDNREETANCEELWNKVQIETQMNDRDLLVSVLSYLQPETKWSVESQRMTTVELYYFLALGLKRLEPNQIREVLHLIPRAVQEQLEMVISATMEK